MHTVMDRGNAGSQERADSESDNVKRMESSCTGGSGWVESVMDRVNVLCALRPMRETQHNTEKKAHQYDTYCTVKWSEKKRLTHETQIEYVGARKQVDRHFTRHTERCGEPQIHKRQDISSHRQTERLIDPTPYTMAYRRPRDRLNDRPADRPNYTDS